MTVEGVPMFTLVKKLRGLKHPFISLLHKQGNLHRKVLDLKEELDKLQTKLDLDPFNVSIKEAESVYVKKYHDALIDEERFLKQKSKQKWLEVGDANTAFFHNAVKCRNHINKIHIIKDTFGNLHEGDGVASALVPGPDGYTSEFFKKAWSIVGSEVTAAIIDFFETGRMLQEINHIIALILKVPTPGVVTDYKPISCCNVAYKGSSKIITSRILEGLKEIVSDNQSAFVPGRRISDNIMLTQELMHNYHSQVGPPRCAMKVDIQKAYDTADWRFLCDTLHGFGFHQRFISWIMECVTSTSFSLSVNGNIHGYFKGKRGLRQGDPMSPYLFTLVMEVLSLILRSEAALDGSFKFHNKCEKQMIINLCFEDDLFLFARGEINSVKLILKSLKEFEIVSGLVSSNAKSAIFLCNVPNHVKERIMELIPFEEGKLPIKYLGVPLLASRLLVKDCQVLVDRMNKRIMDWKNRFLSFAGSLQLVISLLSSIHVYWASVFKLPAKIIKELESKMKWFLWGFGTASKGRAKVAWKEVCLPKAEGGLGIRRIADVNKSLMAYHIFSILSGRKSLWTDWVDLHRLKGRSIWDIPVQPNAPWGWKKLLKCRSFLRVFFWSKVGNGHSSFIWFDKWCDDCPLVNFVTRRQIARYGFSVKTKVTDVIEHGLWTWPDAWRDVYPVLFQLQPLNNSSADDQILWRNSEGKLVYFTSKVVWNSIRIREQQKDWSKLVWSSFNIPKHAFTCWLILKRKLWTQDRILQWNHKVTGSMNQMCCLLCYAGLESHEHLFFQCAYSKEVWNHVRSRVGMSSVQEQWEDIISWLIPKANSKSVSAIVSKLVVAASAYSIWSEINTRFFSNRLRPPEQLSEFILSTVRSKLMSFKYKATDNVRRLLEEWKIDRVEYFEEQ
ncbi:uncharacterized protein LOC110933573 [Helianthus annuus]|uniref:uncharacterized protein LOC110933573 n=1 Tax=Helianthus annuus TaxID=4232 RepID=UPI000B8FB384|nr:uncharacterized protein LOC110933573 [Helianthus annuus]